MVDTKLQALCCVDAAAMHPSLSRNSRHYYKACLKARNDLKGILSSELEVQHDLYVLSNTTHAFLTAAFGLLFEGFNLSSSADSYAPYKIVKPELFASASASGQNVPLVTHINPETGAISDQSWNLRPPVVVDVAQSFATVGFHNQALAGDILVCPLHKHAGLARGLGLLAIKRSLDFPKLRSVANLAESGTADLKTLSQAISRAAALQGRLINRFVLTLQCNHRAELERAGITIHSPLDRPLPFAIFGGINPVNILNSLQGTVYSMKYLKTSGLTRVSGAVRGHLKSAPQDHAAKIVRILTVSRGLER